MKHAMVFGFLFLVLCGHAQRVQTIAPKQVVAGNAFQVQYVINDIPGFVKITAPSFENLRLISGPNFYLGRSVINGIPQGIENIAYTLIALKPGIIKINAAIVSFKNNKEEKTEDLVITVIPQPRASFNTSSTYTDINLYAPASKADLDKLIDENLFIKTEVDKTVCFLGEAITATFKLYSRLQSTSEVINAPSLYGFSIMDMLNINEAHQAVETINGKVFNTSVLRKLQLYPAQTGQLVIDEMQLENEIEFNDSTSGKKVKIKKLLASKPVTISVKPLPGQQPANYSGAVGKFTVQAAFQNPKLAVNAQGKLIVTISGKGNFLQFGPPAINWPKEFEVFDPIATDELNKNKAPAEGRRMYTYNFTADRTGNFIIPAVSFSFFNPATASYHNLSSDSLQLEILPASSAKKTSDTSESKQSHKAWWILALAAFAFLLSAIFLFKKRKKQPSLPVRVVQPSYQQKLRQFTSSGLTGREICTEIQNLLIEVTREHHLTPGQKQLWQTIRNDCQLLVYSDIQVEDKKLFELQKKVEDLLQQIES